MVFLHGAQTLPQYYVTWHSTILSSQLASLAQFVKDSLLPAQYLPLRKTEPNSWCKWRTFGHFMPLESRFGQQEKIWGSYCSKLPAKYSTITNDLFRIFQKCRKFQDWLLRLSWLWGGGRGFFKHFESAPPPVVVRREQCIPTCRDFNCQEMKDDLEHSYLTC